MLLGAGVYIAVDEGVGHPAAGGPAAVLMEDEVAVDVEAAHGDGLRDGPLHGAAGGRDGKVFGGAPEGGGGVVVVAARGCVDVDVAGDVGGVGCGAEAGYFGVEADGDVEVIVAGKEEEGVALRAELVVLLEGVDAIDLGLHGGGGRRGREDGDVGAEVGSLGNGGGEDSGKSRAERFDRMGDQDMPWNKRLS